jgi:hypothetical protein
MPFEDEDDNDSSESDALSPFEQALGQSWDSFIKDGFAQGKNYPEYDVPQAARVVYESGGAEYPYKNENLARVGGPGDPRFEGNTDKPSEIPSISDQQPNTPIDDTSRANTAAPVDTMSPNNPPSRR